MIARLRCLLVGGSESDAGLIVRQLERAGYEVVHERVETAGQMRAALEGQPWDAVIADYTLPGFSGPAALTLLGETGQDLPFLVISGAIGEEAAAAIMKAGAHDYLLKSDLSRLGPAMERELRDAETRRERRRAEAELRESEARFRCLVEGAPVGIVAATRGRFRYLNQAALEMLGAASDVELLNRPVMERLHPDYHAIAAERIRQIEAHGKATTPLEEKFLKLDGAVIDVEVSAVPYVYGGESGGLLFFCDVSERVQHDAERAAMVTLLDLCNAPTSRRELVRTAAGFLQTWSGCEAVGVRVAEGYDFPYYETRGLPPEFVRAERELCARDAEGELLRDDQGNPVLECMCGNVLRGRFDPSLPFFTKNGSFWTNSTSELLASTTEAERQGRTRNRCSSEGYESVALVPMRFAGRTVGLLQFNDKREGRFSPALVGFLERIAGTLATALEERSAHATLRESEERYRSLFENMREGYAYCRMEFHHGEPRDFLYLVVNDAFEALTGLKGVVGRRVSEVIPRLRELCPELFEIYGRVSLTGTPETFEGYVEPLGIWLSIAVYGAGEGHFITVFDNITEREQVQQALLESEQRYRELFENSQFGIYRTTPDGRILLANPALLSMLGYASMEELAARNLEEEGFEPRYDRAWFKDAVERYGVLRNHEARWTRRDGGTLYVLESATAVRDSQGAVLYYDGTVEDITDRQRVADALRKSEERFRQVAEDATVFVWEIDADGLYTYASPVVETILGYTPGELVGKRHYYDLFAPEVREDLKAAASQAFAERRPIQTFLNPNVAKDGRRVILETNGTPMLGAGGILLGYRGADRDVTDRARAMEELLNYRDRLEDLVEERTSELARQNQRLADEVFARSLTSEALKRSEGRLQLQMDWMPIACLTIGPDFTIRTWNHAAERVFGFSPEETTGAPVLDLIVPEELRPEIRLILEKTVGADETVHYVNENLTKDGGKIICEWTNARLVDSDGGGVGLLCMAKDVTARRRAEEALRVRTQELESFNRAMIGREKRLIELKEEVNLLSAELGRPPAYPPVWKGETQ